MVILLRYSVSVIRYYRVKDYNIVQLDCISWWSKIARLFTACLWFRQSASSVFWVWLVCFSRPFSYNMFVHLHEFQEFCSIKRGFTSRWIKSHLKIQNAKIQYKYVHMLRDKSSPFGPPRWSYCHWREKIHLKHFFKYNFATGRGNRN